MIDRGFPWLPSAAPGELERRLETVAAGWAAEWFPDADGLRIVAARPGTAEGLRWHGNRAAAVGATTADLIALGQDLAGGRADPGNPRDAVMLERLGEAAIGELAARLVQATGSGSAAVEALADGAGHGGMSYRLGMSADWGCRLAIDEAAQVELRRRMAGKERRPSLGSISAALAPVEVTLGCHLGTATLATADLAGLTRGDLIVLEKRMDDSLALTVSGAPATRGKATLAIEAEAAVIRISEAIDLLSGGN